MDAAEDSEQALALLAKQSYTLVLLDLNLAGESGLELLQRLISLRPSQRIVMLTAYASIAKAVEAGADNYLCKPINTTEIMNLFVDAEFSDSVEIAGTPLSVYRLEWEHLQKMLIDHNGNISATVGR